MKLWSQLFFTLCCLTLWSTSVFSFDEELKDRTASAVKSASRSLDADTTHSNIPQQAASTSLSPDSPKEAFDVLPREIWVHIAKFIPGDDLHNYLLTCKSIYNICMAHPPSGPHPNQLFSIILSNEFRGLRNLSRIWKLSDQKRLSFFESLQNISSQFSDHDYTYEYEEPRPVTELECKIKMRNFTIDTKCLFLLYHLGAPDMEKTLTDFKGDKLCQYLDSPKSLDKYPYALKWKNLQGILCHPDGFKSLYHESEDNLDIDLKKERKEALKYKASFAQFTQLMLLFTSEIEEMTDIF